MIDDVDGLYAQRSGVRLRKCFCRPKRRRRWRGTPMPAASRAKRIRREFTTKSRVVIISNDWQTLNKNVTALQDRGHVLHFEPGAAEVHREAGRWFDDAEIYRWFGENLHRVREPSLRHYVGGGSSRRLAWTGPQCSPRRMR